MNRIFAPIQDYSIDPRLAFIKNCTRCKLGPHANEQSQQVVMPVGDLNSRMAIILENPGWSENETGYTLVGPSYPPLVGTLVRNYGFNELTDFVRTNVNWCFPPKGTKPTKSQIRQCRHNLDALIRLMPNLKLIIPVGDVALKAIEGDDAVLSLRVGRPGKRLYTYANGLSSGREFFTIPLRHPAWLLRIENDRGRIKANQEYQSHLKFIRDFYDNLDNIESFQHPYKYHICYTQEEAFYWANRIATDPEMEVLSVDYETSEIRAPGWGEVICMSFAFELDNNDQIEIHAVVFPLKQCIEADNSRIVKAKGGKRNFEHKWMLAPWFDEAFEPKLISILKPCLTEMPQPTKRPRLPVVAWNSKFEGLCTWFNWNFEFMPTPEQVPNHGMPVSPEFVPRDLMLLTRSLNSDLRSLSLKTVLSACIPLLASEKDPVIAALEDLHGKNIITETGFMLMAIKPPDDISREQMREWGLIYNNWLKECAEIKDRITKSKNRKINKIASKEEFIPVNGKREKIPLPSCPLSGRALEITESNWCSGIESTRAETLFERNAFDTACTLDLLRRFQRMSLDGEILSIGQMLSDDIFI